MPDEKVKIPAEKESVKKLDELVSISLNADGTVNLKLPREQFTEAVKEAIDEAGDGEIMQLCVLKYQHPDACLRDIVQACTLDGMVLDCRLKFGPECPPISVTECPPDLICAKLRIPEKDCRLNRIIDIPTIRDWIKQGILLERTLSAQQLKQIKADRI